MSSASPHPPNRQSTILIVDDESVVTQSLRALLELETDHHILTFQSPAEALRQTRDIPVDLVITDFLMPDMNGLEFLSEFKRRFPEAPRIMLTGYADKENSIRAINEVGLFQYIEKPWDNDQIRLIIDNALTNKSLRETLNDRIRDLDTALRERQHLAKRNQLLREELEVAQRLQRGMLPVEFPAINGMVLSAEYIPALEVGGDFYDVIHLPADRLGILVADVTGHGIQAALSTAVVKLAFSNYKDSDCSPNEIVTGMNRLLLRALPEETFAAALVMILDTKTGECRLANAGLPHPFVLHREGADAERINANGFMLGAIDESLFRPDEEHTVQLVKGDFLMVYTDGVSEVQNAGGVPFDQGMLKQQLTAHHDLEGHEIAKKLIKASQDYGTPDHPWDDITVLGIDCV